MTFGRLLRKLRTKKGVSIKQLAPALGLNYTYISKLENSKVNPSSEVVEKMSHYFDYDSDELMVAAGKLPKDVENILKNNPQEAVNYLRKKFGGPRTN
jgi:transcriptional regulator with XRE-family HTH domain